MYFKSFQASLLEMVGNVKYDNIFSRRKDFSQWDWPDYLETIKKGALD